MTEQTELVVYQMTKKNSMHREIKTGAPERVLRQNRKETAQNSIKIQWQIVQPPYCYSTSVQII